VDTTTERRLARAAYEWLRISPLATLPTLFIIYHLDFAVQIFHPDVFNYSNVFGYANLLFGVVVSGLWHLNLLRYVNNPESEFVRRYGRKALKLAAIRTAIPVTAIMFDYLVSGNGVFSYIAVIVLLLILWSGGTKAGLVDIDRELGWAEKEDELASMNSDNDSPSAMLEPILWDLRAENEELRLSALERLDSVRGINTAIRHELELLSDEDDNEQIRRQAQYQLSRFTSAPNPSLSQIARTEEAMSEDESNTPEDTLNQILEDLQSGDETLIIEAISEINNLKFSSAAIRRQLEKLSLRSKSTKLRKAALNALNMPAQRNVAKYVNKLSGPERQLIVSQIKNWEKDNLIEETQAELIGRRYDFDMASRPRTAAPTPPLTDSVQPASAQPEAKVPETPAAVRVERTAPASPPEPEKPRLTLLQTLTSEASIKIYLYLGAFLVIASAVILGVAIPELRLPILATATIIFGGLSVSIKKRLPQPSFALFIVFSFLLPITANTILATLRQTIHPSLAFEAGYWAAISFAMALVWSGGTRLYESRLFSITAFASLAYSFYKIGIALDAKPEFFTVMIGVACLSGLAGAHYLKKWRDASFALPLFMAAQLLQAVNLAASILIFGIIVFDPGSPSLWHLGAFVTWMLAFGFYTFSNSIFPFQLFPWVTAATLIPMPWFIAAAFNFESLGSALLLLGWGAAFSFVSEASHHKVSTQKYSLPILLASMPALGLAAVTGFANGNPLALAVTLGITVTYAALHYLRTRWWLWTLALTSFILSFIAFIGLDAIQNLNIFFGYEILSINLLFLLPDLFLKNDFKDNLPWRLPLRIFGALFTALNFLLFAAGGNEPLINTAIIFLVYTVFMAVYAIRYNQALVGYLSTTAFAISAIYLLNHFAIDQWVPTLSILAAVYFFGGFSLQKREGAGAWRTMLEASGLILGSLTSIVALIELKEYSGWLMALIGLLFIMDLYSRKADYFEIGAQILFSMASLLILHDLKVTSVPVILEVITIVVLTLDTIFVLTYKSKRTLDLPVKILGGMIALMATLFYSDQTARTAAIGFGIFSAYFLLYALIQKNANYGYVPAGYLPLTIFLALDVIHSESWLPILTGLALLYFIIGLLIRKLEKWSIMIRNSALILGTILSFAALYTASHGGGWYALLIGLLFAAEMYLRRDGRFEAGLPVMFNIGAYLILTQFNINELTYHLLAYSLVWLLTDLLAHLTFTNPRPFKWIVRGLGILITAANFPLLFVSGIPTDSSTATIGYGTYALLFLTISLLYRQPTLLYAFTATLPLFVAFLFRGFGVEKWIHPLIVVSVLYYAVGYFMRSTKRGAGWDLSLLYSGLGLGIIVSLAAPTVGGLDAAIPVSIAATLWAVEAFAKKNAWLAFPANGLYLLSYFIILFELDVNEPQFFSIGAALLGLIQHYLLVRAESKSGTFIMGMVSQFVLLGSTYIEMVGKNDLSYFVALFLQSLVVLIYGIVIRSRSLTFFPIGFVVLGVMTVIYSALKGPATIVIIGCTGILLLGLGILAVMMRERITLLSEKLSDWKA